jgi:hypothetical protein
MESIAIHGPQPHPFLAARIDAEGARENERLEQRARSYAAMRIEERAVERPCDVCGQRWLNKTGTTCCYCGSSQARIAAPKRVEYRSRAGAARRCGNCGGTNWPNCCLTMYARAGR